jgi:hypothetical protein
MNNIEKAAVVRKAFNMLLKDTTTKATQGCKKSALDVIRYMTVENEMLRSLGYMINDNGRIVKFKPWKYGELVKRAAQGDMDSAEELLNSLNTNP